MRAAVVGHVEWIRFARVDHVPRPGEIVHAREAWEEPGGGGSVAAVQLRKLAGAVTFFTTLGDDDLGHRAAGELADRGVDIRATFRPVPQRWAFTHVDRRGERTITVIGDRLGPHGADDLPWEALEAADAVYFTAGDDAALRLARRAGILVATSRVLDQLRRVGVVLDAVVGSDRDQAEGYSSGAIDPPPELVVRTRGPEGGRYELAGGREVEFAPAEVPGPVVDAYGCGDSFAAGLTFGLGSGMAAGQAVDLAARCGAACLTGRGPYEGQLTLA